jgi:hypothetical protein
MIRCRLRVQISHLSDWKITLEIVEPFTREVSCWALQRRPSSNATGIAAK